MYYNKWEIGDSMIDYYKYLRCPECVKVGLYCKPHKIEVEQLLVKEKSKLIKT